MRIWRKGAAALLAAALLVGVAQAKPAKIGAPPAPLTEEQLVAAHGLMPDQVGYVVFDPATGGLLAARNADRAFIPASVAKVPTAVAALAVLGPQHRFETALLADGPIADGVLAGDLYLKGGGDPLLMTEDLGVLVEALKARSVVRVAGRFAYDVSLLPPIDQIDPVQPDAAQYNPGLSALTLNFNRIALAWEHDGAPGSLKATAFSESRDGSLPVAGILYGTAPPGPGPAVPLVRAAGDPREHWLISPQIEKAGRTWLPLRRPGAVAAQIFRSLCAEAGIALPAPEPGVAPEQAAVLAVRQSEPLVEILRATLKYSNNLAAELAGLATARRLAGETLSLDRASAVVADWYRRTLPDTDWAGYRLDNFSGLSSASRATPAQIAAILAYAAGRQHDGGDFASLLPLLPWETENDANGAGGKGAKRGGRGRAPATWKPDPAPDAALRAKTGTVAYGRGLAGYVEPASGGRFGFVIFISDLERRRAFDASPQVRSLILPPEAKDWLRRARSLERALLLRWTADRPRGPPP